jgi:fatty-acyl-CoA synthase
MSQWHYYQFLFRYLALLAFKKKTLGGTAERMAVDLPNAPCVLFENDALSFEQFNRAANRRANLFKALGGKKGDTVALLMENRPEFLTTLAGLAKLGVATAAINTNLAGPALAHCLNLSGAVNLIVGAECLPRLLEVLPTLERIRPHTIYVDTRWPGEASPPPGAQNLNEMLAAAAEANPPPAFLGSMDLLMYIYTSGTTGLPKAARITHYRWYAGGLAFGFFSLGLTPADIVYCALPLYHSNGSIVAFSSSFQNGAALALSRRFSAGKFWEEAARFKATSAIYIGEVLRYLVNTPPGPFDRAHAIRQVLGNGLRPDIWKAFQERFGIPHIREFYASTEGNAVTVNVDDTVGSCGSTLLKLSKTLFVVRFDVERNEYLRDDKGFCVECAPGEVGELVGEIKFATPFGGYTNPAETEKKVLRGVFKTGDAFFKTGDLMKVDAQGRFFFVDRIGDTFRWKGENVSTQEVQELLAAFPGIQLINVFGVTLPGAEGRAGMAVAVLEGNARFDPSAFFRYGQERLPAYARPAFVRVSKELDVTGTFKLRKVDLQKAGFDPGATTDPLYYRDDAQTTYLPLTPQAHAEIKAGRIRF